MNNLPQTQQDAKQAHLTYQSEQMLAVYEKANTDERKAIIKQINSFLSVVSKDGKIFWLKFRPKLEMLNEAKVLFSLGQIYLTVGAREALLESNEQPMEFLARHQSGDWGIVGLEDKQENEFSLHNGFRLLSAYRTALGEKIWVITEADRGLTTLLLPEEY